MNKTDPLTSQITVSERFLTMHEVLEAYRDNRLVEMFCCGTAAIVSPVRCILYRGEEILFPTGSKAGPITARLWEDIVRIQYGRVRDHPWSVLVTECL